MFRTAVAVFALALLPLISRGEIVSGSGPSLVVGLIGSPPTATIDLDGDGNSDITLSAADAPGPFYSANAGVNGVGSAVVFTQAALPVGSIVDNSLTFNTTGLDEASQYHPMDPSSPFNMPGGSITGRFGFRFISGGQTHYGWADLAVSAETFPTLEAGAGVPQWAYESQPNTPITVGAVPEPASEALLLVTAPALLWRRR